MSKPDAWLEIDEIGTLLGVSIEKDASSPFRWVPLYQEQCIRADERRRTLEDVIARCEAKAAMYDRYLPKALDQATTCGRRDGCSNLAFEFRARIKTTPAAPSDSSRIWKSRIDCWYKAHRDPGQKPKPDEREVYFVMVEAPDSEAAISAAVRWAGERDPRSGGRLLLRVEHRSTGPVKFPIEVSE